MKNLYYIIICLFSLNGYAQTKDLKKMKPEELINEISSRENKIKELEAKLIQSSNKENLIKLEEKNIELLEIITNNNEVFLYDAFNNKYILNKDYFKTLDLDINAVEKTKNSTILIKSILVGNNCSEIDKAIGEKALVFNINYLKFIELDKEYNTLINEKYNEKKNNELILKLDSLHFEINSKLDTRKSDYIAILKNYAKYTCDLKNEFAKKKDLRIKNPANPNLLKSYDDLKKNAIYKTYPYLIKIIDKVKTKPTTYVEEDDLPCVPKIEENTAIITKEIMQEEKKPIETKKE